MKSRLTPLDIEKTQNTFVKSLGLVFSKDARSSAARGGQLYVDYMRGLHVGTIPPKLSIEAFEKKYVEQFSAEQRAKIAAHYSQGPMLFAAGGLSSQSLALFENAIIKEPKTVDRLDHLYVKNGEVYFKARIEKVPVHNAADKKMADFHGPIESAFQLTDEGFQFQHCDTDSDLMRNMMMGTFPHVSNPEQYFLDHIKSEDRLIGEIASYKAICEDYLEYLVAQMGEENSGQSLENLQRKIKVISVALTELIHDEHNLESRKKFFIKKSNDPDFKKILGLQDDLRGARFISDIEKTRKQFAGEKLSIPRPGIFASFASAAAKLKSLAHHHPEERDGKHHHKARH